MPRRTIVLSVLLAVYLAAGSRVRKTPSGGDSSRRPTRRKPGKHQSPRPTARSCARDWSSVRPQGQDRCGLRLCVHVIRRNRESEGSHAGGRKDRRGANERVHYDNNQASAGLRSGIACLCGFNASVDVTDAR